ncbi:AMP-binding protein [Propioniciclava sp. MC1683]|uniref:AMP-binding protein n=1 Tax=Propioniciclava sp. MC1683 TaxID=2760309 RepID=UPI001C71FB44|nr:AMP-binding protein [Propioniciclava sp. MC1683]
MTAPGVVDAFAEVRPTFMVVVPQLLSRIRQAARDRAGQARIGPLFRAAEATAVAWGRHLEAAQDDPTLRPPRCLALRRALFDRLFYRRMRGLMGGRVEWLLSGAAPLDPTLAHFFRGVGIPVIEGYGLTETTAPATGLRPGDLRAGSVGPPIPGTTVRIAEDGEVLVRGVGVFSGYQNKDEDAGAFTDGFFRTGDLGSLDDAGRLTLHGRRKNLIITATGKNVAPEPWEAAVGRSPLVAHAILVGEGRSHLTAALLLEPDAVRRWAQRSGHHDLAALLAQDPPADGLALAHPALLARLQRPVDRANAAVSRAEQVRRFVALLVDTSAGSPFITPTLKLRRDAFLSVASHHIEDLYRRSTP